MSHLLVRFESGGVVHVLVSPSSLIRLRSCREDTLLLILCRVRVLSRRGCCGSESKACACTATRAVYFVV